MQIRPASSPDLATALEKVVEVASKQELLVYLQKNYDFWNPTEDNVKIEWYCFDDRINWNTYIVLIDGKAAAFMNGCFK
jgi:hypothetical protein